MVRRSDDEEEYEEKGGEEEEMPMNFPQDKTIIPPSTPSVSILFPFLIHSIQWHNEGKHQGCCSEQSLPFERHCQSKSDGRNRE